MSLLCGNFLISSDINFEAVLFLFAAEQFYLVINTPADQRNPGLRHSHRRKTHLLCSTSWGWQEGQVSAPSGHTPFSSLYFGRVSYLRSIKEGCEILISSQALISLSSALLPNVRLLLPLGVFNGM